MWKNHNWCKRSRWHK